MHAARSGASAGRSGIHGSGVRAILGGCLAIMGFTACAAEIRVTVRGPGGPVAGAIVSLQSPAAAAAVSPAPGTMDQRKSRFVPDLLVVQAGSEVAFPNSDKIRHNVYSFSPAKRFELPLYKGSAPARVRFDTPGVVAVGCNIHDWMVAHILVLDTPHWAVSDPAGQVRLNVPPGNYSLQAWHPGLSQGGAAATRSIAVAAAGTAQSIDLKGDVAAARVGGDATPRSPDE